MWPFGREAVSHPKAGALTFLGNVVWFLVAGWWLAIGHIVSAVLMAVTMIGIPLAIAEVKLVPISLAPLGTSIVQVGDRRLQL